MENDGPHDRGRSIFVGVTVTIALATVFVAGRIASRFCILKHRQWDDYTIILAWILAFAMSLTVDFSVSKGMGRQASAIPASNAAPLLRSEYAACVLYNPALMATKTSILIFYIRISKNTRVFLRRASYITLAVVIVSGVILTLLTIFRCHPVRAAWVANVEARCLSIEAIYLGSAPISIATDLAVVVLPIPVVTSMTLPRRQKCVLVLTFLVASSVTVVDVIRICYLQLAAASLSDGDRISAGSGATSLKFSYNASLSLLLSAIEVNIGIICACVPVMRPLIKLVFLGRIRQGSPQHGNHGVGVGVGVFVFKKKAPSPAPDITTTSTVLEDTRNSQERRLQAINEAHEMRIVNQTQIQTSAMVDSFGSSSNSNQAAQSSANSRLINREPRSLLNINDSESFKYCTMVTVIYYVWGVAYALLFFNGEIPISSNPTPLQSQGIICAFYVGRVLGPIIAIFVLRASGFKATLITGLGIYCVGSLMFWPSGSLRSYPGFVFSGFVTGVGVSVFAAATYGFLVLCGPPHHADFRSCLSSGVKSTGLVVGGVISQKILINNVVRTGSLVSVQWTYLASALSTAILGLCFHYMPLPEASDAELQAQLEQLRIRTRTPAQTIHFGRFRVPVHFLSLAMAFVSMTFNNGAWACADLSVAYKDLVTSVGHTSLSTSSYFLVAMALYAAGQCLSAPLSLVMPGHALLLLAQITSIAFAALTMVHWPSANVNTSTRLILSFVEAPTFPLLFSLGLQGLGRWTKPGVCLITSASGIGACAFPFITVILLQSHGVRYAFCTVVALFAAATVFPWYLILFRPARNQFNAVTILSARLDDNSTTISSST